MRKIISTAAIASFLVSSSVWAYQFPNSSPNPPNSGTIKVLQEISDGVAEIATYASKAVVFVSVSKTIRGQPFGQVNPFDFFFGPGNPLGERRMPEQKQKGLGSGFIVDLQKGYVITNNHVIEGADEITLKLDNGATYEAKVLGRDKNTDVAVVQINDKNYKRDGLNQLMLGDSDKVKMGEFVIAVGAPFGLETSTSFGTLSAVGRGNLNITSLGNFLQTDAAINPGNSGGPLLNTKGEVIGMNTAIYSRSGSSAGIGFAVPSNLARKVAEQLVNKGKVARGFLGVQLVQELDEDIAVGLGLKEDTKGALISSVQPGTPAAKAGLESGDVITHVNNSPIKSNSDLTNSIGLLPPGTTVGLTLFRNGKRKNSKVILGEFPSESLVAQKQTEPDYIPAGLTLKKIDESDGAEFQAWKARFNFKSKKGLLITAVAENSKGEAAGLRPGDVILKVNKKRVDSPEAFRRLYKKSKKLLIHLEREGTFLFAAIRK